MNMGNEYSLPTQGIIDTIQKTGEMDDGIFVLPEEVEESVCDQIKALIGMESEGNLKEALVILEEVQVLEGDDFYTAAANAISGHDKEEDFLSKLEILADSNEEYSAEPDVGGWHNE